MKVKNRYHGPFPQYLPRISSYVQLFTGHRVEHRHSIYKTVSILHLGYISMELDPKNENTQMYPFWGLKVNFLELPRGSDRITDVYR